MDVFVEMAAAVRGGATKGKADGPIEQKLSGDKLCRQLREHLRENGAQPRAPSAPLEPARSGLGVIAGLAGLASADRAILQFVVALHHSRRLAEVGSLFGELTLAEAATLISVAVQVPMSRVLRVLSANGKLAGTGLVTVDTDPEDLKSKLRLKADVVDLISVPGLDRHQVLARFVPEAAAASLRRADFAHLGDAVAMARDLVDAALRTRRRGMNILFHGPTGTGKTELAKLLARDLAVKLYAIGKADGEGDSATALERLTSLRLANQLVGRNRAVLLFDELEDLFEWGWHGLLGKKTQGKAAMSKQWFNDILERNATPTIWITNATQGMDPAFLRRFSFAVEFRPLGVHQRARILRRHLGRRSQLSPDDVAAVAERFSASPAQIGSAVRAARLLAPDHRPDRGSLERVLAPV